MILIGFFVLITLLEVDIAQDLYVVLLEQFVVVAILDDLAPFQSMLETQRMILDTEQVRHVLPRVFLAGSSFLGAGFGGAPPFAAKKFRMSGIAAFWEELLPIAVWLEIPPVEVKKRGIYLAFEFPCSGLPFWARQVVEAWSIVARFWGW